MTEPDPFKRANEIHARSQVGNFTREAHMEGLLGEIDPSLSELSRRAYDCVFDYLEDVAPDQMENARWLVRRLIEVRRDFVKPDGMADDYNRFIRGNDTREEPEIGDFDEWCEHRAVVVNDADAIDLLFALTKLSRHPLRYQIVILAAQRRSLYERGWPVDLHNDVLEILYVMSDYDMHLLGHEDDE